MQPTDPLTATFRKAQRHLSRRDEALQRLIRSVGPCTFRPSAEAFVILVRSIVSQMISTKAAVSIYARLEASTGPAGVTPASLLALGEDAIRAAGLSGSKARALADLAARADSGELPLAQFPVLGDDEIIEHLVQVRGIGTWTAQMFLIFCLGRLDVLPVDDLGLRAGVQACYNLDELPARAALRERAEPWRPYRSVATWYFWRSRGQVPQSKE
jgi:DNA-3-methyladenine glycosylase II